jgi:dihydroxyacetone kinase
MVMQKIINGAGAFVDEMLEGLLLAHPESLRAPARRVLVRADAPRRGKVAIVTGGGSGHLPLFLGYVGTGLADAVAVGDVFASPSSEQILEATRAADGGAGVLYLYGNYSGDTMNFDMASELAEAEGTRTATVVGADDVASAPRGSEHRRRGVAGIALLYKVAGARAEQGGSLDEVAAVAKKAGSRLRSMGVALSPCTVPAAGAPTFTLQAGEMEIGMGIHGEPGVRRGPLEPAEKVAEHYSAGQLVKVHPRVARSRGGARPTRPISRRARTSTPCGTSTSSPARRPGPAPPSVNMPPSCSPTPCPGPRCGRFTGCSGW